MSATLICEEVGQAKTVVNSGPDLASKKRLDEQLMRAHRLESIGMLASGIAHDLNNVLAPIILAAPVLREHATDPDDLRIISSLEKSAERGVALVRQILSFAHGAGSTQQLLQVKALCQETVNITEETFPKNIRVEASLSDNLWSIMADATQVHQVLLNLCVNARDAMPDGGSLYLRAENCLLDEAAARKIEGARPGAWVVLQVQDSGTGIPAGALAHIWEPFFTTKETGKGTGLGLSTVRSIVEYHNGFINLKTTPGSGTTFRVYLPAVDVPAQLGGAVAASSKGARGNGELIMIVDDEPQIRDVTASLLSRNGYRVLTACDGTEAVALFATRRHEVSVLITDLIMPNLGGVALAAIVQHLNPGVKILAMSGLSSAGRSGKVDRYCGAFLFKPFKVQSMLDAVYALLHPEPLTEVAEVA